MPEPTFPDSEANYLNSLEDTDFLNGGHRSNFIPSLQGTRTLAQYVEDVAVFLSDLSDQVETDAASASQGSGTEASVEQIWSGLNAYFISIRRALAAQERQTLTFATPLALDFANGINFKCTLTGDTTLPNPSNQVPGASGFIDFIQDATGGREITSYGSNFVWFGDEPSWPAEASAITKVAYYVAADGEVHLSFAGNSA